MIKNLQYKGRVVLIDPNKYSLLFDDVSDHHRSTDAPRGQAEGGRSPQFSLCSASNGRGPSSPAPAEGHEIHRV